MHTCTHVHANAKNARRHMHACRPAQCTHIMGTHAYTCACMQKHACTPSRHKHMHSRTCTLADMYTCSHRHMHRHTCRRMNLQKHACTHWCMHTQTHTQACLGHCPVQAAPAILPCPGAACKLPPNPSCKPRLLACCKRPPAPWLHDVGSDRHRHSVVILE